MITYRKKIMLVDYEPRATALVRPALEATGRYVIKEEHDSRCAMNSARFFQPDLILFDIAMNHRSASAVAREMQADPAFKNTPVVFLSVNTSSEGGVMSGGILSGYSFFANPVRIEDFVRCVAEILYPSAEKKRAAV
ncbi:MAG: response regulator [Chthoniobacterales bacterium]